MVNREQVICSRSRDRRTVDTEQLLYMVLVVLECHYQHW